MMLLITLKINKTQEYIALLFSDLQNVGGESRAALHSQRCLKSPVLSAVCGGGGAAFQPIQEV